MIKQIALYPIKEISKINISKMKTIILQTK